MSLGGMFAPRLLVDVHDQGRLVCAARGARASPNPNLDSQRAGHLARALISLLLTYQFIHGARVIATRSVHIFP